MRLILFLYVLAAFCVILFASATPTRLRSSPREIIPKRDQGALPSLRLQQATWQEMKARQEQRKSPLYKRQQTSATATPPLTYPTCNPFTPTINVARYMATEITTVSTLTDLKRATELACVQICQRFTTCRGYVYVPGTQMCYLKVTWPSDSFSSTTSIAMTEGVVAGLLGQTRATAASGGGKHERKAIDNGADIKRGI